jgi:hypothetical protein
MDAVHAEPASTEALAQQLRGVEVVVHDEDAAVHDVLPGRTSDRRRHTMMEKRRGRTSRCLPCSNHRNS